jgi:hypothetical protein
MLPFFLTLGGAFFATLIYIYNLNFFIQSKQNKYLVYLINFLIKKWYFDKFYSQIIGLNVLNLSYKFSYRDIDRGLIEFFGPFNFVKTVPFLFNSLNKSEPLFFVQSIALIFFGLILFFLFFLGKITISTIILVALLFVINLLH